MAACFSSLASSFLWQFFRQGPAYLFCVGAVPSITGTWTITRVPRYFGLINNNGNLQARNSFEGLGRGGGGGFVWTRNCSLPPPQSVKILHIQICRSHCKQLKAFPSPLPWKLSSNMFFEEEVQSLSVFPVSVNFLCSKASGYLIYNEHL